MVVALEEQKRSRKIKVIKKHYRALKNATTETVLLFGGAGSGKSRTIAQFLIYELFLKLEDIRIYIFRKSGTYIWGSVWELIVNELEDCGALRFCKINKTQRSIELRGKKNKIVFRSLDDPEKIKSTDINYAWLEELTEFTREDFEQIGLRLRRKNKLGENRIFGSFNPIHKKNWVYSAFFQPAEGRELVGDVTVYHSTYKDNRFLPKKYTQRLERLKKIAPALYEIYTLGKFASLEGVIYKWKTEHPNRLPAAFDEIIYGVDFGFNNPFAFVKIGIKDGVFYILREIYTTHKTTGQVAQIALETPNFYRDGAPVYCDAAEPDRIEELKEAGINALPAHKGRVTAGITYLQSQSIIVSHNAPKTIIESESYSWKKEKDGTFSDEPVKILDHTMDAIRYAIITHTKEQRGGVPFVAAVEDDFFSGAGGFFGDY